VRDARHPTESRHICHPPKEFWPPIEEILRGALQVPGYITIEKRRKKKKKTSTTAHFAPCRHAKKDGFRWEVGAFFQRKPLAVRRGMAADDDLILQSITTQSLGVDLAIRRQVRMRLAKAMFATSRLAMIAVVREENRFHSAVTTQYTKCAPWDMTYQYEKCMERHMDQIARSASAKGEGRALLSRYMQYIQVGVKALPVKYQKTLQLIVGVLKDSSNLDLKSIRRIEDSLKLMKVKILDQRKTPKRRKEASTQQRKPSKRRRRVLRVCTNSTLPGSHSHSLSPTSATEITKAVCPPSPFLDPVAEQENYARSSPAVELEMIGSCSVR
jgi:hypothetical protein